MNKYERTVIVFNRAKQVVLYNRESFEEKLKNMGITGNTQDQIVSTEGWQETLAKAYERKPKPIEKALEDLENNRISYAYFD